MDASIVFGQPVWFLIPGVIILIFLSVWGYRKPVPPVTHGFQILLTCLRACLFVAVFSLLFDPRIILEKKEIHRANIAVLTDRSASMTLEDGDVSRQEMLSRVVSSPELARLSDQYDLHYFGFSDTLHSVQMDSLTFDDQGTDIGKAIQSLMADEDIDFDAAILISDGRSTEGYDPGLVAQACPFPVFTVPIGEKTIQKDILITQLFSHDVAYVNDEVPVLVTLRGPGFEGQSVEVQLFFGSELIDRATARIPAQGMETQTELHFVPQKAGLQVLTARVKPLQGERTAENNESQWVVNVLKSKISVLILANAPTPDYAFMKRNLATDDNLKIISRVLKSNTEFYEGPVPQDSLNMLDCCILMDLPNTYIGAPVQNLLKQLIQIKNIPYFMVAGRQLSLSRCRTLDSEFPVSEALPSQGYPIQPQLTSEGVSHAVTRIDQGESAFHSLPPVISFSRRVKLHPRSLVLLEGVANNKLFGQKNRMPLLIAFDDRQTKRLVFLGDQVYRWDLMMGRNDNAPNILQQLLQQSVRWLAVRADNQPFSVEPVRPVFKLGDAVELNARLLDDAFKPIKDGRVEWRLVSERSVSEDGTMVSSGDGAYHISIRALPQGHYQVYAQAFYQDNQIAADTTEFVVVTTPIEFLQLQPDLDAMQKIANVSGGKCVNPDSLSLLKETMHYEPRIIENETQWPLLERKWMLILLLALLSFEWFIRKRLGLL